MFQFLFSLGIICFPIFADVIVTDTPNRRFLVLWSEGTKMKAKICVSLPDEGRPRECEEKQPGLIDDYVGLSGRVEKALTKGLSSTSLLEATQKLERNSSQRNAKRVIDLPGLNSEKQKLEYEQSSFVTLERFRKSLDTDDFEIDIQTANPSEKQLATTIATFIDEKWGLIPIPREVFAFVPLDATAEYEGAIKGFGTKYDGNYRLELRGEKYAVLEIRVADVLKHSLVLNCEKNSLGRTECKGEAYGANIHYYVVYTELEASVQSGGGVLGKIQRKDEI